MKWLKNLIRKIARTEIENMLTEKKYIDHIKIALQNNIEQQRVSENEDYLRGLAKHEQ